MDFRHSFAGGWIGTYAYTGRQKHQKPVRFEAAIRVLDTNAFTGDLIDDNYLGDSDAVGEQAGRRVRFTKTYRKPPPRGHQTAPIEYSGTISDDGRTVAGSWRATFPSGVAEGVWDARRTWSEEQHPESSVEFAEQSRELVVVGDP
jgi:hypothetical protein